MFDFINVAQAHAGEMSEKASEFGFEGVSHMAGFGWFWMFIFFVFWVAVFALAVYGFFALIKRFSSKNKKDQKKDDSN